MDRKQLILLVFVFSLTVRSILQRIFSYDIFEEINHKKRQKELRFNKTPKKKNEIIQDWSGKISEPIIKYLFPHIRIGDLEEVEKKLKGSQWDRFFTPIQFVAISIGLKIVGVFLFVAFIAKSKFIAILLFLIFGFLLDIGLKSEMKERHDKLLVGFPDFIEVMNVYLSSGKTYTESLMETMKTMSGDWKKIIEKMIIVSSTGDIDGSLDVLVEEYNTVDVREFTSLIKISRAQGGGNLGSAFKDQARKADEMYIDAKEIQIEKRKTIAIMIQAFLMIAFMVAFGLPMIGRLRGFF